MAMSLPLLAAKPESARSLVRTRRESSFPTSGLRRQASIVTENVVAKELVYTLEHVTKLKSGEKDFNRKGVTWLDDGSLVILNYGNDELKVFDSQYRALLSKQLSEGCKGISFASGNTVAVTRQNRVFFFSATPRRIYETSKCFILGGSCYGISQSGPAFAVTVDVGTSKKQIVILDDKGKILHNIKKLRNHESRSLSFYVYLAVDNEKKLVYASDVKNNKIVCVSFKENLVWERDLPGKPRGICLVSDHLVVGTADQRLVLLNESGYIEKVLAFLDFEPECLAFDSSTNRLAVSQYFRGWVHVYQVS